jgi:hypothetical protein
MQGDMKTRLTRLAVRAAPFAVLCLFPAWGALLQDEPEIATHQAPATFTSRVNLVSVPVVVRDSKGRAVGNLRQEDFQLFDKGKLQVITKFTVNQSSAGATGAGVAGVGRAAESTRLAISGLALSKEVRPASELGLEASLTDEGTPLIAGGMQVTPSGSNVFTKSEQAFCYFEVYPTRAAETATPDLRVDLRILDRKTGGQKWSGGPMKLDPPAGSKSAIPAGLNVPITSLPAGSYQLEVTATGGDEAVKRTVEFEIK